MCEIISMFPFILTIVFLHHDLAKLKPAWFCSRCSVVSVSSAVNIITSHRSLRSNGSIS